MKITLTLDNGPHPDVTPEALRVLAHHGITVTFFVLGKALESAAGRALAERAHREGHRIGNHTYSHNQPFGLMEDQNAAINEVAKTQQAIGTLADEAKLFRPFAGEGHMGPHMMTRTVYNYLAANNYSCVTWNSIPRDWVDDGWVERALADITTREWSVLVVHDMPRGGTRLLDDFLKRAKAAGAEFVTSFPSECTPLWRGKEIFDFSANITEK
jgi:peptidoglycan/xylan/chitin deacetylase (PgdA/CDA1 family)